MFLYVGRLCCYVVCVMVLVYVVIYEGYRHGVKCLVLLLTCAVRLNIVSLACVFEYVCCVFCYVSLCMFVLRICATYVCNVSIYVMYACCV